MMMFVLNMYNRNFIDWHFLVKCWTYRLGQFKVCSLGRRRKIKKMPEHRVPRDPVPDDCNVVVGYDTSTPRRLAAMGT